MSVTIDVEPLHLALVWQDQDAHMDRLRSWLDGREVLCAVTAPAAVQGGTRADLVVAVSEDAVLVHDAGERVSAGPSPAAFAEQMTTALGARVLPTDRDGEVAEASCRIPVNRMVHQGESDPERVQAALAGSHRPGARVRVHQDVVVMRGLAPGAGRSIAANSSDSRASLSLEDKGGWVTLSWWSKDSVAAHDGAQPELEPDLRLDVGRPVWTCPASEQVAADSPAAEVLTVLRRRLTGMDEAAVDVLTTGMSRVRAEQSVASLRECASVFGAGATPLAGRPWLPSLRDAVEMLGFEPRTVDLLAGTDELPADAAVVDPDEPEETEPRTPTAGTGRVPAESGQAQSAAQKRRTNAIYVAVVVEMLIGALFLFVRPLPWEPVNMVVAAVAIVAGVVQLLTAERRR